MTQPTSPHFGLAEPPFSQGDRRRRTSGCPRPSRAVVDELLEAARRARARSCSPASPASARPASCARCATACPQPASASPTATTPRSAAATSTASSASPSASRRRATAAGVFYAVATHVEELGRERVHPVFLLDEAHLLHQDTLDHLHILLNYEWDRRALLSLVLVGLPELHDRLALRRNRSLYSRLHHRLAIDAAHARRHRRVPPHAPRTAPAATASSSPPTPSPCCTRPPPARMRDIDRLATAALREAARKKRKLVERDVVARVIEATAREAA